MFNLKKISLDILDKLNSSLNIQEEIIEYNEEINGDNFNLIIRFRDVDELSIINFRCTITMDLYINDEWNYYNSIHSSRFDNPRNYNLILETLNVLFTSFFRNSLKYGEFVNEELLSLINNKEYNERFKDPEELINNDKTKYKQLKYYSYKFIKEDFLPLIYERSEMLKELIKLDDFSLDKIGLNKSEFNIKNIIKGESVIIMKIVGNIEDVVKLIKNFVITYSEFNYYYDDDELSLYIFTPLVLVDVIINEEIVEHKDFDFNYNIDLELGFLKQNRDVIDNFFYYIKKIKDFNEYASNIEDTSFYNHKDNKTIYLSKIK